MLLALQPPLPNYLTLELEHEMWRHALFEGRHIKQKIGYLEVRKQAMVLCQTQCLFYATCDNFAPGALLRHRHMDTQINSGRVSTLHPKPEHHYQSKNSRRRGCKGSITQRFLSTRASHLCFAVFIVVKRMIMLPH